MRTEASVRAVLMAINGHTELLARELRPGGLQVAGARRRGVADLTPPDQEGASVDHHLHRATLPAQLRDRLACVCDRRDGDGR
jgi:hypothetical protein